MSSHLSTCASESKQVVLNDKGECVSKPRREWVNRQAHFWESRTRKKGHMCAMWPCARERVCERERRQSLSLCTTPTMFCCEPTKRSETHRCFSSKLGPWTARARFWHTYSLSGTIGGRTHVVVSHTHTHTHTRTHTQTHSKTRTNLREQERINRTGNQNDQHSTPEELLSTPSVSYKPRTK